MAPAYVTAGAAKATVLKVTQTEPSHGFVAWQTLVDGCAPKSSNDPATVLQPILATPKRCKDAEEWKERLTVRSLKVAEYEHQFKVIDETENIRGEGNDAEGHQTSVFHGTEEVRRNYGEASDHRQQNDGR